MLGQQQCLSAKAGEQGPLVFAKSGQGRLVASSGYFAARPEIGAHRDRPHLADILDTAEHGGAAPETLGPVEKPLKRGRFAAHTHSLAKHRQGAAVSDLPATPARPLL